MSNAEPAQKCRVFHHKPFYMKYLILARQEFLWKRKYSIADMSNVEPAQKCTMQSIPSQTIVDEIFCIGRPCVPLKKKIFHCRIFPAKKCPRQNIPAQKCTMIGVYSITKTISYEIHCTLGKI